jgi:pimeloyl-ACP methyl ester carboxylesterase
MRWTIGALGLGGLLGCAPQPGDCAAEGGGEPAPGAAIVELRTLDGVCLFAEVDGAGGAGPGVVLVHPSTPSVGRGSWPRGFVGALQAEGFRVLRFDRRGAGRSGAGAAGAGAAAADVEAARGWFAGQGGGPVALLGAEDGTVGVLDVGAAPVGEAPAALVFLSGGPGTEANHPVEAVAGMPVRFVTGAADPSWARTRAAVDPSFSLDERGTDAVGIGLLSGDPAAGPAIAQWLAAAVQAGAGGGSDSGSFDTGITRR